jgi:hypothetical protein
MTMEIIDLRATAAAALIVESRIARIKAKIDMGLFSVALEYIESLRDLNFDANVSAFVRAEAQRQAGALMVSAMQARHPKPTGAA